MASDKRDNLGDIFLCKVPIMGGGTAGEEGVCYPHANMQTDTPIFICSNTALCSFSGYRALTKDIDIGLSIQRIEDDVVEEFLIQGGAVSPIVTIEPRRRKFHKVRSTKARPPKFGVMLLLRILVRVEHWSDKLPQLYVGRHLLPFLEFLDLLPEITLNFNDVIVSFRHKFELTSPI